VAAGLPQGRRPDLHGGGLVRSAGGWAAVQALRRGREAYLGDERVLGSTEFVEAVRREVAPGDPAPRRVPLPTLVQRVCAALGLDPAALATPSRRREVARARAGLAYLWVSVLGQPGRALALALGLCPQAVYQAVPRGAQEAARWTAVLDAQK
jgi:putative transposase